MDSIKLTPGKHTIIPAETPQGSLYLKMIGNSVKYTRDISTIVRQKDSMKTLNIQSFGLTEKYIVGKYDLEILCLPRLLINDVDISQSTTTTVEIPQPGIAVIQMPANGYGSVYYEDDNKLNWIYNLREYSTQESLVLQPGKYRVVFRSKLLNKSAYTVEKSFVIKSSASVTVKLF